MPGPRDPETRSMAKEHATYGDFEVVLVHDEHGELGTLDRDFSDDVSAGWAAHEATHPGAGIKAEVREVEN